MLSNNIPPYTFPLYYCLRRRFQRDVLHRALFLMRVAPGANFRTVIQRHPRVSALSIAWVGNMAMLVKFGLCKRPNCFDEKREGGGLRFLLLVYLF